MGVEDSIRKATENAMEDLAGTSKPVNDQQVPEPGEKDDDIQVHSSISEGSNAMDEDLSPDKPSAGAVTGSAAGSAGGAATGSAAGAGQSHSDADTPDADTLRDDEADADVPTASGDVSGPAGLPEGDPDDLRADPSEGGGDPSTSMGRG
ncbi:hypothetical protein J2Y66_000497 [Paenarthrobacter nitroguajacolicus]|uniref:hypothetical protein n=1 Tax=Paenarthrobacter nitroguajacolicus TaxID=211146 RepID=UPI00285B6EC9|nr:hypothetical protein [Paenarthrobacter nitroguajacolicus]MDR6986034.1 hypothetical protein [Paenarthrobacter nitroguajacolicus]